MKTTNLSHIRYEVCDVDGVLMPYDRHTEGRDGFVRVCTDANIQAVRNHLPHLDKQKASELSHKSYKKYSDPITAFRKAAEKAGHNWEELKFEINRDYHSILFKNLPPEYFTPDSDLVSAIKNVRASGCDGALASHSCLKNWLTPAFNINGMGDLFDPEHRLGMEELVVPKQNCGKFLHRISDKAGVPVSQMAFLEDTLRNLVQAKRDCPDTVEQRGITSIYINPNPLDPDDPNIQYVDAQFPTATDFYRQWKNDLDNMRPNLEFIV